MQPSSLGEAIKARALAETAQAYGPAGRRQLDIREVKDKKRHTDNETLYRKQLAAEERVAQLEMMLAKWQALVAMMAKRQGGELVIDFFTRGELPKSLEVTGDPSTGRTIIRVSDEAPNVAATEDLPLGAEVQTS